MNYMPVLLPVQKLNLSTHSGFTYTSWQHRLLSYEDNSGEVTLLFCLRYAKFNLVLSFTMLLLFSLLGIVLDVIII